jgi:DNA-binding FadR family transcriptional regulator
MQDEPWHVKRLRELEAAAPAKRKKVEPFVQVPLWWIAAAARAAKSPATLVLVELLHASWRARSRTFSLPNGRLRKLGVSREIKRRVLRDLETARLITVDKRHGKPPRVTLTV